MNGCGGTRGIDKGLRPIAFSPVWHALTGAIDEQQLLARSAQIVRPLRCMYTNTDKESGRPGASSASLEPCGKRILFIGLSYYSYTEKIIEFLRKKGFAVEYRPSENRSFWSKSTKKLFPSFYKILLGKYHESIVVAARKSSYDYVFFLQIHSIALDNVEALRASQPTAKFILYNWDSLTTHDYRPYLGLLDAVFTFDRDDAKKVAAQYLPLFALPDYFVVPERLVPSHDIYFVGAIGSLERFAAIRKLDDYCKEQRLRFLNHLHCSPAILLKLLRNGLFMGGLSLRALSTEQIIHRMNDSVAVFDFPNHAQSGYTMRLIENLCAGKKIITSNVRVRQEEFYSKDQFFVVENLDFTGLKDFLKSDTQGSHGAQCPARRVEFSLDHWLDCIFEG
jgi:hypothetical protein